MKNERTMKNFWLFWKTYNCKSIIGQVTKISTDFKSNKGDGSTFVEFYNKRTEDRGGWNRTDWLLNTKQNHKNLNFIIRQIPPLHSGKLSSESLTFHRLLNKTKKKKSKRSNNIQVIVSVQLMVSAIILKLHWVSLKTRKTQNNLYLTERQT